MTELRSIIGDLNGREVLSRLPASHWIAECDVKTECHKGNFETPKLSPPSTASSIRSTANTSPIRATPLTLAY